MSDKEEAKVHVFSKFATVATHPTLSIRPFFVAPTVATEFNALGIDLKPVGCVGLSEALFDFDSSFVRPDILGVMKEIPPLRDKHKNALGEPNADCSLRRSAISIVWKRSLPPGGDRERTEGNPRFPSSGRRRRTNRGKPTFPSVTSCP
jgi:hypothetical protein